MHERISSSTLTTIKLLSRVDLFNSSCLFIIIITKKQDKKHLQVLRLITFDKVTKDVSGAVSSRNSRPQTNCQVGTGMKTATREVKEEIYSRQIQKYPPRRAQMGSRERTTIARTCGYITNSLTQISSLVS